MYLIWLNVYRGGPKDPATSNMRIFGTIFCGCIKDGGGLLQGNKFHETNCLYPQNLSGVSQSASVSKFTICNRAYRKPIASCPFTCSN